METLVINIPEKKIALVKQLLKELGVEIESSSSYKADKIPNALTAQTIEDAQNGIGVGDPILDIKSFINSL